MQTLTVYKGSLYGIDFSFDSVAFTIPIGDGWKVYWYGICIALGFLLAVTYCFIRAKKYGINLERLTDVVLFTTPLAILCARVYYIIFDPSKTKIDSIGDFFGFSGASGVSGLAIYGGVIGAVGFGLLFCKIRKVNALDGLDLAASGFLIGQAVGRWGNFFNQEAFGTLTSHGMMSNGVADYVEAHKIMKFNLGSVNTDSMLEYLEGEGLFVHPTFLYESLWCIAGFVILHFVGNRRKFKGQVALSYGVWYGIGRAIIEQLRTDSLMLGPLKVSQWLSGALVIACAILLIYNLRKLRRVNIEKTYVSMFDDIDSSVVKGVSYYEGEGDSESDQEISTESEEPSDEDSVEDNENDDLADKGENGNG